MFYFKVFFPCLVLYGTQSAFLYRKARLGDFDSLDKLLRLDKIILIDPRIAKQIPLTLQKKGNFYLKKLGKAISEPPDFRLTNQKVKIQVAGVISLLTEAYGERLTEAEIRKLFDAIVIDQEKKEVVDLDLPESPETFAKAIQRARNFWEKHLLNRTKLFPELSGSIPP